MLQTLKITLFSEECEVSFPSEPNSQEGEHLYPFCYFWRSAIELNDKVH